MNRSISLEEIISRRTSCIVSFGCGDAILQDLLQNNFVMSGNHQMNIVHNTGNIMHSKKYLNAPYSQKFTLKTPTQ